MNNMLPKLKYRLALDMGTNSIGWCLLKLNKNFSPEAIIKMGVRIFSDGRNPKDGTSLAVTRRLARQIRRRRDRLLKRKSNLLKALVKHQFFPYDEQERKKCVTLDPYEVRRRGLSEQLSGKEFARALFHMNQRRGFKSNRKVDKNDKESGALKQAITILDKKLQEESSQTLGEWLAKRHQAGLSVRARLRNGKTKDKYYDFYASRSMIEHEFEALWAKQSAFNPQLFNNAAYDELKDILLFQRPLKPVLCGRCSLIPEESRAPLAIPSTQLFRIYQEVNNLRIVLTDLTRLPLNKQQRDQIVDLLIKGKNASFSAMIKTLKLQHGSSFNLEDIKRKNLNGNKTAFELSKDDLFGQAWHEFSLEQQDIIVDRLLNEPSEHELVQWLTEYCDIDSIKAQKIADSISVLPEGYGHLSKTAIDRILPKLMEDVITYDQAVRLAGFESHSELSHAEQTGEIMSSLPYYGEPLRRHVAFEKINPRNDEERFGKIANPTVHIGLNQLRKVVNSLIKRYGNPTEIVIEVARDLKLSRKQKADLQKEQADRQKRNKEWIEEACRAIGRNPESLDRSKKRELSQKMQLWSELNADATNRCCSYTGQQISIDKLLSDEVEIEHILPYSRTLDDSLNNKTVCIRKANRDKGNRTPYEAFGMQKESGYDYDAILQRASHMPKNKALRFAKDGYEYWLKNNKDFLARALNDTAYLSRISKEYLSLICPPNHVRVIPGRMTALLRKTFGLNKLISNSTEKNRDDHRHHALDAAVIGITDQGLLQRFSQASAKAKELGLKKLLDTIEQPWANYREQVSQAIQKIIVSHKPDHGYQGAMHEETAWGIREDGMAQRRIIAEDTNNKTWEIKKKQLIGINSTRDPHRHKSDKNGKLLPYKGYVGGSNYSLEIFEDSKGKWQGNVISTFDAYQIIRELGESEGIKQLRNQLTTQSGKKLIMRLMINDYVSLKIEKTRKSMRVVQINSRGLICLAEPHEANIDARNRDSNNSFKYTFKLAGSLQKADGLAIVVSPIGKISTLRN